MADVSGTPSEFAPNEIPTSELGEATPTPEPATFPPYPPYATEPAPPSVAETIIAGRDLRIQHKSLPRRSIRPPPKPARPKGPKATDVKLSRRAALAHARCLRKHGAVLTDRLERMAKPPRRSILCLWRERADTLPAETISRLRSMLDADEPFKPDQAYEYFINMRKMKKRNVALRINQIKKDALSMCGDKRFLWARNATVAFARGIQQRLSRPGRCVLADGMLRLSNIILNEICGYMRMKPPSRRCTSPKAKFMMEVADKVAVWIDEILSESDDRMLMMDFDEDEDILRGYEGGDPGFADDFLNMMGEGRLLTGPQPGYLKFTGEMFEAFMILTESMYKKGDQQLLSHGKYVQSYKEGADELKRTPDFDATDFSIVLAQQLNKDLNDTAKSNTPENIIPFMKDVVNICSNYLAQHAEFNKDKGPAFKLLVNTMRTKPNDLLYHKDKIKRNYGKAASELEDARSLESDHDDPNLSQEIYSNLSNLVSVITPDDLKNDMKDTLDLSSKYLSQRTIDEIERGPAFDILIKELETHGGESFTPQFPTLAIKFAVAYTLKSAPGLSSIEPNTLTVPIFASALHNAVDAATPKFHQQNMKEVIGRCANYLSAYIRDRDKALQLLLKMMKSNPNKEVAKRNNYSMSYGTGATEIETAPILVPFLPVKDIADEGKQNFTNDMESLIPSELKIATKALIQDVARYLSQSIALRSGAAGERYPLNFLTSVKKSLGTRPLFKYKAYGQTYSDAADVLKYAGPLESNPKCEQLQHEITAEMKRGVPMQLAPAIATGLNDIMVDAAKHLAKIGMEKGQALEYLLSLMKERGETPLGQMQGYQQSYKDGARRIENAPTLTNDKVDKGVYESVRGKLTKLVNDKPSSEFTKALPGIVDESAKFLASPMPESGSEKRRVLADLMARKGETVLAKEGLYKLTYTEGGEEIMKAPLGEIKPRDEAKKKGMHDKLIEVIPDKRMQDLLKDPANEGAAYLADIIKGRGEAMQVLHDKMKSEKDKDFITVGKFKKNHDQAANMLDSASHFGGQHPSPVILDKVKRRIDDLPKPGASNIAKQYMNDTSSIVSNYIAGVSTKECGLDAKALTAMDSGKSGMVAGASAGAGTSAATEINREVGMGSRTGAGHGAGTGTTMISGADKTSRASIIAEGSARVSPETEEERQRRLAEEDRKRQKDEEKRRRDSEKRRLEAERQNQTVLAEEYDPEREQAMQILHKQLRSRGGEIFYKQPQTELTHGQASLWLGMKPLMAVENAVKESADTARLHKKFERKLSTLVGKVTPADMRDAMQDVIIESSLVLSEYFVSNNYKALVREALVSEMQKRENEILIELDGVVETFFFAAQRLKKSKVMDVKEPCSQVAHFLIKKLDDMVRCRSMPRKLTATMKDHIKDVADYLSEIVTKPDKQIEAYISLLGEMEATGDTLLIEGVIAKSYKEAAAYLRRLTSFEDQIKRPNSSLQSSTESKLKNIMTNIVSSGYTKPVMNDVISNSTRLLVSYIMLQGEKTEVLKILIQKMEQAEESVLLRHGHMRKSYSEAVNRLRGKNTDQLGVCNADPVVARKIQIKLNNLMRDCTPEKYLSLMNDVIEDATMYLAIHLLEPHVIQVCKCMKNVFVQCELWCDEILRRVARPCCTCSRHVSAQALEDLAPGQRLYISPGSSKALAPGLEISLTQCPSKQARAEKLSLKAPQPCPAPKPTDGCQKATTSYLMYSTEYTNQCKLMPSPTRLPSQTPSESLQRPVTPSPSSISRSFSPLRSILFGFHSDTAEMLEAREKHVSSELQQQHNAFNASPPESFHTAPTTDSGTPRDPAVFNRQSPTALFVYIPTLEDNLQTQEIHVDMVKTPKRNSKTEYKSRVPIISSDQMSDWHAMMVSLMWNVQAWRDWLQENIDRALAYKQDADLPEEENWITFQRRVTTEVLQWRQYNNFSRQLTLRLTLRYRDKEIVSPTRATNKTKVFMECQKEMLDIIQMFNRWTQWLMAVINEADSLRSNTDLDVPLHVLRWSHLKKKVEENCEDWTKYNTHLNVCWENKYRSLITDWLPAWQQPGAVWVVSACGAVPSGAVAAGTFDGEVVWVARTTHKCSVLPAALHPSKHCCVVYADGAVHHFTRYQVMCNATVSWIAWRAGAVGVRAVRVASGVYVGRVHYRGSHLIGAVHAPNYRCHVVLFGRPFAFNCYELLVLTSDDVDDE